MAVLPPDPVFCLKSDMDHIHSLCFPQNDENWTSNLLAATESGNVYFWDLETNRVKHKQHMGESIQAVHSVRNDQVLTQEKSGQVKLWKSRESSYELSKTYTCSGGYCRSIVVDDNLVVAQEGSTVDVLAIDTMAQLMRLTPHRDQLGHLMCVQSVEIGPAKRRYILGGYETGDVVLWDYETSKPCGHVRLREYITSITYDPITGRGVCGNASNTLQIFTIDGRDFTLALKCELSTSHDGCNVVRVRDDRKILVAGGWDGNVRLFSWKTLRPLAVLDEHKAAVTDVQFTRTRVRYWDANIMAASGADGLISLWNLYN